MVAYWLIITPAAAAALIYIIRKIRCWQWGWIRNRYALTGKTYIVTGANTGLGFETTKALVDRDATVIMACRSLERANHAIAEIRKKTVHGRLIACHLDLGSFDSIVDFVDNIKSNFAVFDCLINNAGLALPKQDQKTQEGIELHFGTNHLGHFLLTHLLLDTIKENNARIVIVSSLLHQRGKIDFENMGKCVDIPGLVTRAHNGLYNNSKLANFYHARELYKRGYDVHVLCPGLCHTDFFRDYNPKWYHYALFSPVVWLMLRSAEQGSENIVHCATDNENTETENPVTGYYVRNLKQSKSKVQFEDDIGVRLWAESEKMCSSVILQQDRKEGKSGPQG